MWRVLACLMIFILCNIGHGDPKVPCHFVFGDSLFDAGNNNDLNTTAKANYAPYGLDFPGGVATGRFTNGLTTSDVLTQLLGFTELIPPFSNASGAVILKGVNYASGSAGLKPESGSHLGDRIWLSRQVEHHEQTIQELKSIVEGPVTDYLNRCLYSINIGSNDYINNYFLPHLYPSSKVFTHNQFANQLIAEYKTQLEALYSFGARKTAIFGLGKIGCIPAEREMYKKRNLCVQEINKAAKLFNKKLLDLVDYLNARLHGASFTFINLMTMQSSSQFNPFIKQKHPCCKIRRSDFQCEPGRKPCAVRMSRAFFDGFHPTELVNILTAKLTFNAPLNMFVHPVDISTLIR